MDESLGLVNGPHDDPAKCPTYYDGCNCTVETLKHNLNCLMLVEEERDSLLLQNEVWKQYHALLGEELNDLAVLATMHGWKSTRFEEGKRFREKLGLEPGTLKQKEDSHE